MIHPELKVACFGGSITGKGDLRYLGMDLIADGFVGDIAHLIVLVDHKALLIADTIVSCRHQSITGSI